MISGLLANRAAFTFRDCGLIDLKGPRGTGGHQVVYEHHEPSALLTQTPFVGRAAELERLDQKLQDMRAGRGGLVMLVGEPGIGKTRTAEVCRARAERGGQVLWGRCAP